MKNYFTIDELCRSATAVEQEIDNTPNAEQVLNLQAVIDNVLNPARNALGAPIVVNSGFRCDKLNDELNGVEKSQHTKGEAADIELGGKSKNENKRLYEWIKANCTFDQLINESNYSWVHVSYKRNGANRSQAFEL